MKDAPQGERYGGFCIRRTKALAGGFRGIPSGRGHRDRLDRSSSRALGRHAGLPLPRSSGARRRRRSEPLSRRRSRTRRSRDSRQKRTAARRQRRHQRHQVRMAFRVPAPCWRHSQFRSARHARQPLDAIRHRSRRRRSRRGNQEALVGLLSDRSRFPAAQYGCEAAGARTVA